MIYDLPKPTRSFDDSSWLKDKRDIHQSYETVNPNELVDKGERFRLGLHPHNPEEVKIDASD